MAPVILDQSDLSAGGGSLHSMKSDTNVLNLEQDDHSLSASPTIPVESNTASIIRPLDQTQMKKPAEASVAVADDGVLTELAMRQGLRNIGKMATAYSFVFLDLNLPAMQIKSIDILESMVHLQNVNLSYNKISDLSPLNNLSFLVQLNVSNNLIESLDFLEGFKNLRVLDASNNLLTSIGDMGRFPALEKLNLNNNQISEIEGLDENSRLEVLDLSANQLTQIGIGNLAVLELYLATNQIESLAQIQNLEFLQVLDVSYNLIENLSGLQNRRHLMKVDVQNNKVADYDDLEPVFVGNRLLRELNLRNNPIQDKDDYRLAILYRCSELTSLDKHKVQPEEKVSALNMFNPPAEVVAARDHINHVVYKYLQPARLRECTLPSLETPYPILVLSGPEACGKIELASRLVQEFPDFFGYLPNHVLSASTTSKTVYEQELEQNSISELTPEEFVNMIQEGRFVSTYSDGSRTMGIMYDVIDNIASEGLACVTHMEYEGILSFKKSFFEPRYLLIIPRDEDLYREHLESYYQMSEDEITRVMGRRDLYIKVNQENPGFFDQVIDSNDIDTALQTLTTIVREYLGLPADYVSRDLSSSAYKETKRSSIGGSVVNNVLRYKVSGGTKNTSGRQVSIRDGMNEAELKSYERRESALREGIRENDLSPESAYAGNTTIYGKPYTAPAAFEGYSSRVKDAEEKPEDNRRTEQEDQNLYFEGPGNREDFDSPLERPSLDVEESSLKLQERASALLDDEVLLENEVQKLFGQAGKSLDGNINMDEAKQLIKSYFESSLFEFQFAGEDLKRFEVSFQSYAEVDGQQDMSFEEFKGWFVYMLRMIKFGLYASNA